MFLQIVFILYKKSVYVVKFIISAQFKKFLSGRVHLTDIPVRQVGNTVKRQQCIQFIIVVLE